jgi:putative endopeptidase
MDSIGRNKVGIAPPLLPFKKIDSISNYSDLAEYFVCDQSGNNSPFVIRGYGRP